jgi:hypothetical protein
MRNPTILGRPVLSGQPALDVPGVKSVTELILMPIARAVQEQHQAEKQQPKP